MSEAPTLKMKRDATYKSAASCSPQELLVLWEEIGRRSIYGKAYRIFKGDPRSCKFWQTFVRLRKLLVEEKIIPVRYFQALFDYARHKRKHLQPHNPLSSSPSYVRKLWRPWPNQLCSPLYMKIYRSWEERTERNGDSWIVLERGRELKTGGSRFQAAQDIKEAWENFRTVPENYPMYSVEQVLSIVFRDFSPHFLYFLPEAKRLIAQGHGTREQRHVFAKLDASHMVRERYRKVYELFKDKQDLKMREEALGI